MLSFFSRRQKKPVLDKKSATEDKKPFAEVLKPIVEAPKPVLEIPEPAGNPNPKPVVEVPKPVVEETVEETAEGTIEETVKKMTSPLENRPSHLKPVGLQVPVYTGRKHGKSQSAFVSCPLSIPLLA